MSLTAFAARNHPQQSTRDEVDDRRTPETVFGPLHAKRRFTVDVAASAENALLPAYWTRETNGLLQSWSGHRVWCNPPYSGLEPWLAKAWSEMLDGGCEGVTMLLPGNRCEQGFWQRHVEPYRDGTVRFAGPKGPIRSSKNSGPPFGCVLLTWERAS